ncbi:MAG: GNAT family N-acetyltransferase, partial [Chloroflexota bacterium]
MKLRNATIADKETLARLHTDSWLTAFRKFAPELAEARKNQLSERLKSWEQLLRDETIFTLVAENDTGDMLGFAQGGSTDSDLNLPYDGELMRLYIAPDAQGQGAGKQLIHAVAKQLQEDGKSSMVVCAWRINQPARTVYEHLGAIFVKEIAQEKFGFDASQTVYVWDDIQTVIDATQSNSLKIREATLNDVDAIAHVHVESWKTTYTGIMPDEVIASRSLDVRKRQWQHGLNNPEREAFDFVAEIDDKIVGFVSGGKPQSTDNSFDCELYAIYLLNDMQGKGIGRKLTIALVKKLHKVGHKTMVLSVLKDNQASRGFYEKMGGTIVSEGAY